MDKMSLRTFWSLFQLSLLIDELVRKTCRRHALNSNDVAVLAVLLEHGSMEGSRVAQFVGRSRQNIHRTLEGLAEQKLVQADRYIGTERTAQWFITDLGQKRFSAVNGAFSDITFKLRERLSRFDSTIVNLEVMVDELASERLRGWHKLGIREPAPRRRKLNVEPE
jgi:DNA-binding MarR family transcriptional regulator